MRDRHDYVAQLDLESSIGDDEEHLQTKLSLRIEEAKIVDNKSIWLRP